MLIMNRIPVRRISKKQVKHSKSNSDELGLIESNLIFYTSLFLSPSRKSLSKCFAIKFYRSCAEIILG